MCGRFTLAKDPSEIAKRFNVSSIALDEFKRGYNIPPTSLVPIVISTEKGRRLESGKWGLTREWAPQITNLQEEKILKGTFKKLLGSQRCIVPADGFYEWGTRDKRKYPVWFHMKDKGLFGFAAIYDTGEPKTFSIFTTAPNSVVKCTHDRMPVILLPDYEDKWLDSSITDVEKLHRLLSQYPADLMSGYEVSPAVNYPKNNDHRLIAPI